MKSYQNQIEEINIDGMLEKDENEVLYGRAGYLSGGFQNLMLDFILGRHADGNFRQKFIRHHFVNPSQDWLWHDLSQIYQLAKKELKK